MNEGFPTISTNSRWGSRKYCTFLNCSAVTRHGPCVYGWNRTFVPGHAEIGHWKKMFCIFPFFPFIKWIKCPNVQLILVRSIICVVMTPEIINIKAVGFFLRGRQESTHTLRHNLSVSLMAHQITSQGRNFATPTYLPVKCHCMRLGVWVSVRC